MPDTAMLSHSISPSTHHPPVPALAQWIMARYGMFVDLYAQHLRPASPWIHMLMMSELERQTSFINLIGSESLPSPAVLAAFATLLHSQTTEGLVDGRSFPMQEAIDTLERSTVATAVQLFGLPFGNVQPHTATQANQIVMLGMLSPGDRILTMSLFSGGHVSHGFGGSFAERFFEIHTFATGDEDGVVNYDQLRTRIDEVRPRLIISGGSAYPRAIDFGCISRMAREAECYHLADISHVAGLICAGIHPEASEADFATMSLHKTMCGPRGGIVLARSGHHRRLIDEAVFPGIQSALMANLLVAKGVALEEALTDEFAVLQQLIVSNARQLAGALASRGIEVATGGTDTHLVIFRAPQSAPTAEKLLAEGRILSTRCFLPADARSGSGPSGTRLGTTWISQVGFQPEDAAALGDIIADLLLGKYTAKEGARACAHLINKVLR